MRFLSAILLIFVYQAVKATEPVRTYHSFSGVASDTTFFIPAQQSVQTSTEVRFELLNKSLTGKSSNSVSIRWKDNQDIWWTATVSLMKSGTDEILDESYIELTISDEIENHYPVKKLLTVPDIDINKECSFCAEITENEAILLAGYQELKELDAIRGSFNPSTPMEVQVHGKADISVIVTESVPDIVAVLFTGLEEDEINGIVSGKPQPCGIWTALDRDTDSRRALAGGRYKLAVVPRNDEGYDIIYLGGAEVNSSAWKPGMRKGILKPTIFKDHYDLIWYDSKMMPIEFDASASVEQGAILTLSFPLLKSTLRFSRRQ